MSELETTVAAHQAEWEESGIEGVEVPVPSPPEGPDDPTVPDPDSGKLFEVPRATVAVDDGSPTVIKVAVGGGVELERSSNDDVEFYNSLAPGDEVELRVVARVSGIRTRRKYDDEGSFVDLIATKSLVVDTIYLPV